MRLLIPTIGTVLTLDEDWTFDLHQEQRNQKFSVQFGLTWPAWCFPWDWVTHPDGRREKVAVSPAPVTLPKGTVLKVDRIYIRSKAGDFRSFDSVTFHCNSGLKGKAAKGKMKGRFWAKLLDVNRLEVLIDPLSMPMPEFR
jgi:hypothetical protein